MKEFLVYIGLMTLWTLFVTFPATYLAAYFLIEAAT
jgi:hypothetical protein